jgi:membrane-anchored glycerophosphoryl diester phosphodiesterase (GDPDase)
MSEPIQNEDVVQDTLSEAWDLFKNDFVLYVLAGLLMIVVSIVSLGLLSGPMTVGFIKLVEKRRAGEQAVATDVFDGFSRFGDSLIASFLIGLGVFIGVLLLVLPGILFGLAMAFTFPAIAIDNQTATGGMRQSLSIIQDNLALSAVFLVIVLVLSGIGSAVVFGTLLTMPFSLVLITLAYHRLRPS